MTTQADDAMLTAYALDELNEAGRAEVEARIAADSSARQAVEDARRVAGILGDELAAEPAPQLTAAQRAAVETRAEAAAAGRARRLRRRRLWLRIGTTAAAATVLIGLGTWAFLGPALREPLPAVVGTEGREANEPPGPGLVGTPGARGGSPAPVGTPSHRAPTAPTTRPDAPTTRPDAPTTLPGPSSQRVHRQSSVDELQRGLHVPPERIDPREPGTR